MKIERKMTMKELRYLLIAMVVVLTCVTAQANFTAQAESPEYQFHTTSAMAGSGTTLPNSAVTGTTTTADMPAYVSGRNLRRGVGDDDEFEFEDEGEDPEGSLPGEPNPIGEGTWALLLMAMAYCACVAYRKVRALRGRIGQ